MTSDAGVLLFVHGGCIFTVADGVQPPKAGSILFCRHLPVLTGDRMLEIGTGIGLAAVLAARTGARVVATDVLDAAVRCARANAAVNGVADRVEVLQGDAFDPVRGRVFDLICTSPPQMPTPADRERTDAAAAADNGGRNGWALLDRVIAGAGAHLAPGGRLVFTLFGFLGVKGALARLHDAGFEPTILGQETQAFPRIGYERLEHIRALDAEATLPRSGWPTTVERYVI
ncbi:MAG TPA: HemK2/MTQ2 family protein methyltransferase, partial [Candidatus Dormibacteraeota bacterium]|nr:HemK2/MTQ2 family protein methyltransferase [Candidatus Dormibacteraeota bacterium]